MRLRHHYCNALCRFYKAYAKGAALRLRPTDTAEYRLLPEQNLEFFDYPADCDTVVERDCYHDQAIAPDEVTRQYTVIPANSPAINIKHEKIDTDVVEYAGTHPEIEIAADSALHIGGQISDAGYFPEHDIAVKSDYNLPYTADEPEAKAIELSDLPEKYKSHPESKAGRDMTNEDSLDLFNIQEGDIYRFDLLHCITNEMLQKTVSGKE